MGHNICIDENTGKASIFVVKEPAWHGLGQVVQEALTAEEAIIQAGLDWDVLKTPIHYSVDGKQLTVNNKFAIIRNDDNRALGIVGKDYVPVQNREAFSFFDALVNEKEAIYHSAGALVVRICQLVGAQRLVFTMLFRFITIMLGITRITTVGLHQLGLVVQPRFVRRLLIKSYKKFPRLFQQGLRVS